MRACSWLLEHIPQKLLDKRPSVRKLAEKTAKHRPRRSSPGGRGSSRVSMRASQEGIQNLAEGKKIWDRGMWIRAEPRKENLLGRVLIEEVSRILDRDVL